MTLETFRPTVRERRFGDPGRCAALHGLALRELAAMRRENAFDLPVYGRAMRLPGGETIACRRLGALEEVDIRAPGSRPRPASAPGRPAARVRDAGTFLAIPGCLARYDGLSDLQNAIPDGPLAGWSLGLGRDVTVLPAAEAGLPAPTGLEAAGIVREVGVFVLPGGPASGILYGRDHIPDDAPFSVSCLVRLRASLAYDYAYADRGVANPVRTYLLRGAGDGNFTWDCPGSISPVIGFCSPHPHPGWIETVTYPWAPWNEDYRSRTQGLLGARRVETACDGAPLLAGEAYRDAAGNDYPHPWGFVMGLQAAGLFVFNGDRLLGARISHFESQVGHAPAVTDPLEPGVWHHAVMTHEADGTVTVYLARAEAAEAAAYRGDQPLCAMDGACVYQASGVNAWTLRDGQTGQPIGAYRMNPAMDMALPRFFHHALSPSQAFLLQQEALDGLFVADDHETSQAAAMGFTPVIIEKEAS